VTNVIVLTRQTEQVFRFFYKSGLLCNGSVKGYVSPSRFAPAGDPNLPQSARRERAGALSRLATDL